MNPTEIANQATRTADRHAGEVGPSLAPLVDELRTRVACNAYAVAVLMEALQRLNPEVAERAADHLTTVWGTGEVGEIAASWVDNLEQGFPIDKAGRLFPRILGSDW